jgi:hypothetical protein
MTLARAVVGPGLCLCEPTTDLNHITGWFTASIRHNKERKLMRERKIMEKKPGVYYTPHTVIQLQRCIDGL